MIIEIDILWRISLPVLSGFEKIEPRPWGLQGIFLELMTEIGSLGRVITKWENYRFGKKSRHDMADELSDILFVLIKLVKEANIVLPERLPVEVVTSPENSFFQLMGFAVKLYCAKYEKPQDLKEYYFPIVCDMISLVGGVAKYYGIDLETAHEEEMRLATLWQRTFFNKKGKKKRWFGFVRKKWFLLHEWLHRKFLDRVYLGGTHERMSYKPRNC